jgi:hypothetical protein
MSQLLFALAIHARLRRRGGCVRSSPRTYRGLRLVTEGDCALLQCLEPLDRSHRFDDRDEPLHALLLPVAEEVILELGLGREVVVERSLRDTQAIAQRRDRHSTDAPGRQEIETGLEVVGLAQRIAGHGRQSAAGETS